MPRDPGLTGLSGQARLSRRQSPNRARRATTQSTWPLDTAIKAAAEEFSPAVKAAVTKSSDTFARLLFEHMKLAGLRFRTVSESGTHDDSLRRRYTIFGHRQTRTLS